MTQKEVLYVEDAVNHELNLISYLNHCCSNADDEKLCDFFNDEIKSHNMIYKKLIRLLEDESNE